jgi:hypothetical protein
MRTVRTFEEFWPFSKKKEKDIKEINQEKISKLPEFLKDTGIAKNILNLKVSRYDVGHSKTITGRLIVDISDKVALQIVRINFIVDDDFFIIKKDSCFLINSGKIELHSVRHINDGFLKTDVLEMLSLQDKIMDYFSQNGLIKSDVRS